MVMEVIEGESVRVSEETIEIGWKGDTPFFLIIEPADGVGGNIGIDLDTGWIEPNRENMRRPGMWLLMDKAAGRPLFVLSVEEGDQPYFTRHHVGNLMAGTEVVAIGIGKKKVDGTMVRLWILPNGMVCGGDDVDDIASRMLGG